MTSLSKKILLIAKLEFVILKEEALAWHRRWSLVERIDRCVKCQTRVDET